METALKGEKRWIASFMVDVVESTAMAERLGPETTFSLMQQMMKQAVETIERFGGYYVEYAGDSVFAIFGAPVAIENATLNACRAAIALQDEFAQQREMLETKYGVAPQSRIGVAGGEVFVAALDMSGQSRLNALGSAVNIAARVQALAPPGEIYCSQAVIQEIEGYAETESVGNHALKGIEGTQEIYRLLRIRDDRSSLEARLARAAGRFVGRDAQIEQLDSLLRSDTPDVSVLAVIGPPGIGKSRTVRQALDGLPEHCRVNIAYCTPEDTTSSLRPVLALLRDASRTDGAETSEEISAWLDARLGPEQSANPELVQLIGRQRPEAERSSAPDINNAMDIRRQTSLVLRALACDPKRRLVIEDTHWLDQLSREVIAEVMRTAPRGARLLVTSREPERFGTGERDNVTVRLDPMSRDDVAAMIASAFRELSASDELVDQIFEKSEGNPLFAEELVRHVVSGDTNGGTLHLPDRMQIGSIQNLVFSRFDTLSEREKEVLKQAAFLGRVIKDDYLELIAGDADEASRIMSIAERQGLVEPVPGTNYRRFSHVLIQDAIADSVPASEAQQLHGKAADILLDVELAAETELAAAVARHLDLAGRTPEAIRSYVKAAEHSWQVYALDVCLAHLGRAETLLESAEGKVGEDAVADLLVSYVRVLDVVGNWTGLLELLTRHKPRLDDITDTHSQIVCLTMQSKASNQCSLFEQALSLINDALEIAYNSGEEKFVSIVKIVKMDIVNDVMTGQHHQVVDLFEQTRDYADSGCDPHMSQLRLYEMAAYHRQQGDVTAALGTSDTLLNFGRMHEDSRALAFGWWVKASISAMIEDYDNAMAQAAESMKHSLPGTMDYNTAQVFHLGARLMSGDDGISNADLEQMSEERLALGDVSVAIIAAFYSAVLYFKRGEVRSGWHMLEHTEGLVRKGAERGLVQQFFIKKAELMLTIAGLLPNPFGKPRVRLADALFALRLRFRARQIADDTYREILDMLDVPPGFHRARIEMGKGLIARSRRQKEQAESYFNSALEQFELCQLPRFSQQVRALMH